MTSEKESAHVTRAPIFLCISSTRYCSRLLQPYAPGESSAATVRRPATTAADLYPFDLHRLSQGIGLLSHLLRLLPPLAGSRERLEPLGKVPDLRLQGCTRRCGLFPEAGSAAHQRAARGGIGARSWGPNDRDELERALTQEEGGRFKFVFCGTRTAPKGCCCGLLNET